MWHRLAVLLVVFLQECGSFNTLGKKFYVFDNPVTWLDAERACEQKGHRLVSISSEYELRAVTADAVILSNDFWTSGSNVNHKMVWTWIDQTDIAYNNFAFGFPKYDNSRSSCIYVERSSGLWKTDDCFSTKKSYVCQTQQLNASSWQYFTETNAFYKALEMGKRWENYENLCADEGGHLVSIHSNEESEIVKFLGSAINDCRYIAIGLRSSELMSMHKNFTWIDGSEMDFEKWPASGAFPSGSFTCGFMEISRSIWMDQACSGLLKSCAVCKKSGMS